MQASNWKNLYRVLEKNRLKAVLVSGLPNVRYISGFTGSDATLLVGPGRKILFTDSRYTSQAKDQAGSFRVVTYRNKAVEMPVLIKKYRIRRLGYEPSRMTHQLFRQLRRRLSGVKLVPLVSEIDRLRARKTAEEIKKIERACGIARKAFEQVLPLIRPGVRESDVALELEYRMRKAGSGPPAFESIVASGKRAALPHGIAGSKRLRRGEMIVLDFGASCEGYFSDQTVTLSLGRPSARLREVYGIVSEAQKRGFAAIRAGAIIKEVDAAARDYIAGKGYGKYFGHGLGHGVGLEVHEEPALNYISRGRLEEGMVVTVEPGIYIPGWGGVRIEDLVVVTRTGFRKLTRSLGHLMVIT